jgi:hypothetical protein
LAELLEVVEPGVVLARESCVVGFYGCAPPGMRYAQRHQQLNAEMVKRYERFTYYHVVDLSHGSTIKLDNEVRDSMLENMRKYDHVIPAAAIVFLGGGFAAAAVRAIGTGLLLMARIKGDYKFVSSIDAGIAHLHAHAGRLDRSLPSATRLATFVDEMRRAAHASG